MIRHDVSTGISLESGYLPLLQRVPLYGGNSCSGTRSTSPLRSLNVFLHIDHRLSIARPTWLALNLFGWHESHPATCNRSNQVFPSKLTGICDIRYSKMDAATLDEGTRSTDGFAAHARVSAARLGYIQDEFVSYLVPRSRNLPTHAPLINIGTHVRTTSIDRLVEDFLRAGSADGTPIKKQIVSIGAGSDTRFWRLSVSYDCLSYCWRIDSTLEWSFERAYSIIRGA
jgi:hypothetical protein